MALTLCTNEKCNFNCKRRAEKPNEHCRSYSFFEPNEKGFCEYQIINEFKE